MEHITLPSDITSTPVDGEPNKATITVSPCYPGYGTTLGNALRRVLLSSLEGGAATAVKIKAVDHEFSTIEHVKEDVVEIILNLKTLRFRMHTEEPVELELIAKGDGEVTAAQFVENSNVEIANPDTKIATITDKTGELNMKIVVQKGRGYVPVEDREEEKLDIGYIAIDSVYTPVKMVNYHTENVRVGKMTNFDKLIMDVSTDGTVTPEQAFTTAAGMLVEQYQALQNGFGSGASVQTSLLTDELPEPQVETSQEPEESEESSKEAE